MPSPNQQIDAIFFYLKQKVGYGTYTGENNIWNYISRTPELEIKKGMFDAMLIHLKDDGYIDKHEPEVIGEAQPTYTVTFKGLLFHGYEEMYQASQNVEKRNAWLEDKTLRTSRQVMYLTVVLAVGVLIQSVYYLVEMSKDCSVIYSAPFLTVSVLMNWLIIGLIVIYLLARPILKKWLL